MLVVILIIVIYSMLSMNVRIPQGWPKTFHYASESIAEEMHIVLFRNFLTCWAGENLNQIETLLDAKQVHPYLKLRRITKQLQYKGPRPHPLAGKKTARGHPERGVFATNKIEAGALLGEHVGMLYHFISQEAVDRFLQHSASKYRWGGYFNEHIVVIDAENHANELAFVNDFRGLQDSPNAKALWVAHRGSYYFCYRTLRDIEANEEILVDYGDQFWPK